MQSGHDQFKFFMCSSPLFTYSLIHENSHMNLLIYMSRLKLGAHICFTQLIDSAYQEGFTYRWLNHTHKPYDAIGKAGGGKLPLSHLHASASQ